MWIVVAVVVIISFTFWGGYTQPQQPGMGRREDTAFTIYGKSYSFIELDRIQNLQQLAGMLGLGVGDSQTSFAEVLTTLSRRYQTADALQPDFVFNLLVLRHELDKNGIHVSDTEARDAFRKLPFLQTEKGEFDGARAEFIQNELGSMGYGLQDMYTLLRDWVGLQKLIQLVSSNVIPSGELSSELYVSRFQTIKAASIPFALDTYKKSAQVTDEEIKKYYDENADLYQTEEKRAVSYVFIPAPDTKDKSAEEVTKLRNEYSAKANDFASAVLKPNLDFVAEAKKANLEVKSLPAFARSAPPEAIKEEFALLNEIFTGSTDASAVSDPVETDKGCYVFKITSVEASKPKELKDAQAEIKETLVTQKAQEAMTKAANEALAKLEEAIKGGKKFEDAAKELSLTPQTLPEFSPANPPTDLSSGFQIASEGRITPAGKFTKPINSDNGLSLVYIISKELRKSPESASMRDMLSKSVNSVSQMIVFQSWFERRRDEANLKADALFQQALMGS